MFRDYQGELEGVCQAVFCRLGHFLLMESLCFVILNDVEEAC